MVMCQKEVLGKNYAVEIQFVTPLLSSFYIPQTFFIHGLLIFNAFNIISQKQLCVATETNLMNSFID